MTPSINRLAAAAEALGAYILDAEYTQVREDFSADVTPDLDTYKEWVTNFQYYNALVCACSGNLADINDVLERDYDELMAVAGREAG